MGFRRRIEVIKNLLSTTEIEMTLEISDNNYFSDN